MLRLVKKKKACVIIRLLRFFFLCFCFLLLSWGSGAGVGRTACFSCWTGPPAPHLADEAPEVDTGQSLGKQAWPERLDIYAGCFNESIDLTLRGRHVTRRADRGPSRCRRARRPRPWRGRALGGGVPAAAPVAAPVAAEGRASPPCGLRFLGSTEHLLGS